MQWQIKLPILDRRECKGQNRSALTFLSQAKCSLKNKRFEWEVFVTSSLTYFLPEETLNTTFQSRHGIIIWSIVLSVAYQKWLWIMDVLMKPNRSVSSTPRVSTGNISPSHLPTLVAPPGWNGMALQWHYSHSAGQAVPVLLWLCVMIHKVFNK